MIDAFLRLSRRPLLQEKPEPPEVLFDADAGPEGVDHEGGEPGEFRAPSEEEMEKFGAEDAVTNEEEVRKWEGRVILKLQSSSCFLCPMLYAEK